MFRLALPWQDTGLLLTPQWTGMLSPAMQVLLLLLVCLAPLMLVLWLYRYELKLVPRSTAALLLTLRLLALGLILFLVCLQPIYARSHTIGLPGRVLIAIDRSDSMDVADPQRPAGDKLRLARALKLAEKVGEPLLTMWIEDHDAKQPLRWFTDGDRKEKFDAARQRQLEEERRQAHDAIMATIDSVTRTEIARRLLAESAPGLLGKIAAKHQVEVVGFNRDLVEIQTEEWAEAFKGQPAEGAQVGAAAFTDLRLPLVHALERSDPGMGSILGVVLLTDGQHNKGEPPVAKAIELGERKLPIYPIALGARQPPPDLAIVSVRAPHAVFKDVDVPVEVSFKATGLKPQDLIVELHLAGTEKKLLDSKTIHHDGKDQDYQQRFPVRLDQVGPQTLLASIRPSDPATIETRNDNNSRAVAVNVADDRARVLLIDGEARWEYHYLASALQRDRTMQVTGVVFDQPRLNDQLSQADLTKMGSPRQTLPPGPDALVDYDCIVLGDVSPAQLPPDDRARLEKYVADRGGTLVILAGKRFMPRAFPADEGDPLRKLLPIESTQIVSPAGGFRLALTEQGKQTRFLEMDADAGLSEQRWRDLPPHFWAMLGRAKPGAASLAYFKDRDDKGTQLEREKQQAILVLQHYGFGRVLYVGLDSTWRWRFKVGDTYHHRFWGQAIRWAAADKPLVTGNDFVRFGTPQPIYRHGEDVEIVARLTEEAGPLKPNSPVGARIIKVNESSKKEEAVALVPLTARAAQPRVLEGKIRELPPGQYAVELVMPDLAEKLRTAAPPEGQPASLRASFTLTPPDSTETVHLETRYSLLEELAAKSGGKVFTPEDAGELTNLLIGQTVSHTEYHEQRLWQWWVLLVVLLGLFTAEWVGRKLAGLP